MHTFSFSNEFMVVFGATTTFFIFFLDAQCFSKEYVAENKAFKDCQALFGKKKVLFYTFCPSVVKEEDIYNIILSEEEYEEFPEKYKNLCGKSRYPSSYTKALLPSDICTDLSVILYSGFMDVISRLPPPGGTTALDIFRTVLITSYHLSSRFMKEFQNISSSSSLRIDIGFEADYETVLGDGAVEFQKFLLWHIKRIFRRSQSDVYTLKIKKGSVGITLFINIMNCVHSKNLNNPCVFSETNYFHKEKGGIHFIRESKEMNSDEAEFLSFLRYLNYQLSFTHYNLLRLVPFTVKASAVENPKVWTEKLSTEINKKDFLFSEITSTPHYDNEMHQQMPLNFFTENSKIGKDGKGNFPVDYFRRESYKNSHNNRIRRYVAREDDSSMKLKVQFQLERPAKNGNEDTFQRHLVSQLARAMRVPVPSIKDIRISSETDVSFILSSFNDENNVMDDISVVEAADSLKAKIRSQQLRLRDLNGQPLMTAGSAYTSIDESSSDYSIVILSILCITLLVLTVLIITVIYTARRISRNPRGSTKRREAYKDFQNFGRDSSQSIGKYSYDSGLWLGPGPEPNMTVPEAPFYRPPTVEQIASTPRPVTAVRTRLKKNWNVDERALSTIPDNFGRNYVTQESPPPR